MRNLLCSFLSDSRAQDLVEYTLLLAMICLASAAYFIGGGGSIAGIWTVANSRLEAGNTAVS